MKKKKGFTLIELLAVIVILAIIALIATPITLNILESSKKEAAKDSAYGYIEAIEYKVAMADLEDKVYEDKEGYAYDEIEVDIKGKRPTGGIYSLKNGIVTEGKFCINGYVVNYKNSTAEIGENSCSDQSLKLEGSIKLSSASGNYTYPETGTFEVIENKSGGALSCETSDKDIATCTVSGSVVTVKPGTKEGNATLTIISEATSKYKEAKAAYVAITAKGTLESYTATDYTGPYDGKAHGITVESSDATITYSTDGTNYSSENPKYTDAGEYIVHFKIEKEGFNDIIGSKKVEITKSTGSVTLSSTSGTVEKGNIKTFTVSDATGALSCSSSSTSIATCSISGTTVTVNGIGEGNATLTINVAESTNYNATSKTYSITVKSSSILAKAKSLVYENGTCKTDGTTYKYMGGCYIKGASTNNYVWYNGFMWRIMGINSDNTVRLITDENVTAIPYGASNTARNYATNEDYIHDWLNDYFYGKLNSTKSIIKEGNYFCSETIGATLTDDTVRTECTSGKEVNASVGLISYDEYYLAGTSSSYLNIGQVFWTMTPFTASSAWFVNSGGASSNDVANTYGVRPVINVDATSTITKGDGTSSGYFVLSENKNNDKTGTLGENATSGEYVKLEGKKYRVVSKDSDGIKLILDGYYDTNVAYGSDNTFTTTSGIGATLNGDVLTSLGLSTSDKIVETTWYQGTAMSIGYTYKTPLTETEGTGITAKVGLIRVGEMLSGQSSTILTKNYTTSSSSSNATSYWTMNKYTSTSRAWNVYSSGFASYSGDVANARGVRPAIKVKTNLTISKGNGTWDSPYEV